jgi:hypothetical protein
MQTSKQAIIDPYLKANGDGALCDAALGSDLLSCWRSGSRLASYIQLDIAPGPAKGRSVMPDGVSWQLTVFVFIVATPN